MKILLVLLSFIAISGVYYVSGQSKTKNVSAMDRYEWTTSHKKEIDSDVYLSAFFSGTNAK